MKFPELIELLYTIAFLLFLAFLCALIWVEIR